MFPTNYRKKNCSVTLVKSNQDASSQIREEKKNTSIKKKGSSLKKILSYEKKFPPEGFFVDKKDHNQREILFCIREKSEASSR